MKDSAQKKRKIKQIWLVFTNYWKIKFSQQLKIKYYLAFYFGWPWMNNLYFSFPRIITLLLRIKPENSLKQ